MPGIYNRDNINYGGMLGNAMASRANYAQRLGDMKAQRWKYWGDAVNNTGNIIGDTLKTYAGYDMQREQRDFQAEEAAKRAQEQLARQREQEAWQAEQNRLQRDSTERIAGLNRQSAKEDRMAQNMMNYQNMESIINQLQFEYDNTSDKTAEGILKRAQLKSQIEQANNKKNYYEGLIPQQLRTQPVSNTVITGDDAEKALTMFDNEPPKTAAQVAEDDNKFDEILKGTWNNANKQEALKLAGNDTVKLQKITNKGLTAEEKQANIDRAINEAIKSGDRGKLPDGYMVRTFDDDNVQYVAKKKGVNWVKVKKWGK